MSMPLMEKGGYFHRTSTFPPDHLHLMSIKTEHWPFSLKKKKKAQMLVHIHQLLYVQ